jgi:hypothetical protein
MESLDALKSELHALEARFLRANLCGINRR